MMVEMTSIPPHILRVFLSSTAVDLTDHRAKVREAILRLGYLPDAMETFVATDNLPTAECRARAAAADAVVVLVAHRYGFVPSVDKGGDGERSMTWLEVDAARDAGKPVLAFLVDPTAAWAQAKEQDRLVDALDEQVVEIAASVRRLREFRSYLASTCIFNTFTTADDLATKVATALAAIPPPQRDGSHFPGAAGRWQPMLIHPLQPARYFHGREALVTELSAWVKAIYVDDHVVSLVAAGGTGKTALASRVLAQMDEGLLGGVLVWSFYEDPRTEEFLRSACEYFSGEADTPVGGRLDRLQRALTCDDPHLLVLDGLERVQAEGRDGQTLGTLDDPQLKRLLRFLASGVSGARALTTSRFPLSDLEGWSGAGHHTVVLEDLDRSAACAVLREWGVRGGDSLLGVLAEQVHCHALTVAVLGSFIGNICHGDPSKAPEFDCGAAAATDIKARKLAQVLNDYAQALDPTERALLARLAAFPRGVSTGLLSYLIDAGGRVAGALAGLDEAQLRRLLARLRDLGLVFAYRTGNETAYTAHPFLREYFERLLDVPPRDIHEVVRARLAPRLVADPRQLPTDPLLLASYESLIEHTRLAGRTQDALDLYWFGMGGYKHLSKWLGENERGLRIVTGFARNGDVANTAPDLPARERASLLDNWGLYAKNLGEFPTSRRAFGLALEIWRQQGDAGNCSAILQDLTDLELLAGRLGVAREMAEQALGYALEVGDTAQQTPSHAYLATVLALLGRVEEASEHFAAAGRAQAKWLKLLHRVQAVKLDTATVAYGHDTLLYSVPGVQQAEHHLMCGHIGTAEFQLQVTRGWSQEERSVRTAAMCDTLLGRIALLTNNLDAAAGYLAAARAFGARAGVMEIEIRSTILAAELALQRRCLTEGLAEARAGLRLTDDFGFGRYSIDLRLITGQICLELGNVGEAITLLRQALARSTAPECGYAWGEADALHFIGLAHAARGETATARDHLAAAAMSRQRLEHPGLAETRAALATLPTL